MSRRVIYLISLPCLTRSWSTLYREIWRSCHIECEVILGVEGRGSRTSLRASSEGLGLVGGLPYCLVSVSVGTRWLEDGFGQEWVVRRYSTVLQRWSIQQHQVFSRK